MDIFNNDIVPYGSNATRPESDCRRRAHKHKNEKTPHFSSEDGQTV